MRVVLKALKLGQVLMSAEDTTHSKDWQERILEGGGGGRDTITTKTGKPGGTTASNLEKKARQMWLLAESLLFFDCELWSEKEALYSVLFEQYGRLWGWRQLCTTDTLGICR